MEINKEPGNLATRGPGNQGIRESGNQGTREPGNQGTREPGNQGTNRACWALGKYGTKMHIGLLIAGRGCSYEFLSYPINPIKPFVGELPRWTSPVKAFAQPRPPQHDKEYTASKAVVVNPSLERDMRGAALPSFTFHSCRANSRAH